MVDQSSWIFIIFRYIEMSLFQDRNSLLGLISIHTASANFITCEDAS